MQVIRNEGVWRLYEQQATLILTDEKQLLRIAEHPELPLFDDEQRGFSGEARGLYPPGTTLNSFMREAAERGCVRVEVSYDFFFGGATRENYPDSPATVAAYRVICDYAKKYGMDFGASLISPLDLGGGYAKSHENTGRVWQYAEGTIENGRYRVPMRRQRQWYNNKGPIKLRLLRVMALAFNEEKLDAPGLYYVDENAIEDISPGATVEVDETAYKLTGAGYAYDRMTVSGTAPSGRTRVLAVAEYATPEIDYFGDGAFDYIRSVIDLHAQNGIRYGGYYSDEMHIQFDWDLTEHFGETEIAVRHVTPSLMARYAGLYGEKYRDFLKYMIYFAYGKHGGEWGQHVMGRDADGAYQTWLFRKRYFEMLSEKIVGLSLKAKDYSEGLFGEPIMTRAHATWQESPTCDHFAENFEFSKANDPTVTRYDYAPAYVYSSTVRENLSACGDYFRWDRFLSGSGTDHPEGGNTDRDYYAQAFACSLGALNRFRRAYCACWGSPAEVIRRFSAVAAAYGTGAIEHGMVEDMEHRVSDVLMLYPTDLNYVEERFGSWMVQYGYCDYITEEMLLSFSEGVRDGRLIVNGRAYRAVVALYQPFASRRMFGLLLEFAEAGGKLVWAGPPLIRYTDGTDASGDFLSAFGLADSASPRAPLDAKGRVVSFEGELKGVSPMEILTDFLPDYVYPLEVADAKVVATLADAPVGAVVERGLGACARLGFRPRDDQSMSTGHDVKALFEILHALGAYAPDSLEARSRPENARYLMQRFQNGAVSIANHYRTFEEGWYGSFFRDEAEDKRLLEGRTLPPIEISLCGENLNGRRIDYEGTDVLTFRCDPDSGALTGFAGTGSRGITIDGREWELYDRPAELCFAILDARHLPEDVARLMMVKADREGTFTLDLPEGFERAEASACETGFLDATRPAELSVKEEMLRLAIAPEFAGKWIAVYVRK